ncbi:hypothetical protein [Allokutzneria oryzae]|uniref:PEP-CTERM sorting domain-containing protein n=1 Tax=Allokutzneria oryzae TaxID=1378989 RepID=A0ABV5ZUV6_9PSEU
MRSAPVSLGTVTVRLPEGGLFEPSTGTAILGGFGVLLAVVPAR